MSYTNRSDAPTATPAGRRRLGRTFWTLNVIEMWGRLAYYNLRVMAPIYIMQADNPGGLHLTATDTYALHHAQGCFKPDLELDLSELGF